MSDHNNETAQEDYQRRSFMKGGILAAAGFGGARVFGDTPPIPAGINPTKLLRSNRTVRIPTDYPTLQDAVQSESEWYPRQGVRLVLLIESGYRIRHGVRFWNGSFGHFFIASEDAVVEVSDDFSDTLFHICRAIGPVLSTMIDMRGRGRNGYWCEASFGYIEEAHRAGKICGIRNAARDGVGSVHASNVRIGERDCGTNPDIEKHGEVSGCGRFNIHCMGGSTVSARHAILSNAKGLANVLATHTSMVCCDGADCSGAAEIGVLAGGASQIDAANVNAVNCGRHGLSSTHCSTVRAAGADVSNAGSYDINVAGGGMINVTNVRTTHGVPSAQDTNVGAFNALSGMGILFNENA